MLKDLGRISRNSGYYNEIGTPYRKIEVFFICGQPDCCGLGIGKIAFRQNRAYIFQGEVQPVHLVGEKFIAGFAYQIKFGMCPIKNAMTWAGTGRKIQLFYRRVILIQIKNTDLIQTQAGNQKKMVMEQNLMASGLFPHKNPAHLLQFPLMHLINQDMTIVIVGGVDASMMPGEKTGGNIFR